MDDVESQIEAVEAATARLLATAARLDATEVSERSLLPGWCRGHVLAHLARNADGHRRMLDGAEQGVLLAQYGSAAEREAEIETGASRSGSEILRDLRAACAALEDRYRSLPAEAWERPVRPMGRSPRPARRLLWARLREVEVHHVDLAAGYGFEDWAIGFAVRLLGEVVSTFRTRGDEPTLRLVAVDVGESWETGPEPPITVEGESRELAAWLTGRTNGTGLHGPSPLPAPPRWA